MLRDNHGQDLVIAMSTNILHRVCVDVKSDCGIDCTVSATNLKIQ